MEIRITALYAAALTLVYLALSISVIRRRQRDRAAWGDDGDGPLMRIVRAHGNFAEYVPMVLILLLLAEMQGVAAPLLHLTGASLLTGRLVHAFGLVARPEALAWRVTGMVLTFTSLLAGTIAVLWPLIGD